MGELTIKQKEILGEWELREYEVRDHQGHCLYWQRCHNSHLVYKSDNYMSLVLNFRIVNAYNQAMGYQGGGQYFMGTYDITNDIISHHILTASNPANVDRIFAHHVLHQDEALYFHASTSDQEIIFVWQRMVQMPPISKVASCYVAPVWAIQ